MSKNRSNMRAQKFLYSIEPMIRRIVKEEMTGKGRPKVWVGTVIGVLPPTPPATTFIVRLAEDDGNSSATRFNLKNKSSETVANGDEVYIFAPNGSLSNAWIMAKK